MRVRVPSPVPSLSPSPTSPPDVITETGLPFRRAEVGHVLKHEITYHLRRIARTLTVLALGLSMLVGMLLTRSVNDTQAAFRWVADSEEVGKDSAEFMQSLQAAQSCARAYVERPSAFVKGRYGFYKAQTLPLLIAAKQLVQDNPEQTARFMDLIPLAAKKTVELDLTMATVDHGDIVKAHQMELADMDAHLMRDIYEKVIVIEKAEDDVAHVRAKQSETLANNLKLYALGDTTGIAIASLGAFLCSMAASYKERKTAQLGD
jgi:CHASE3 domain sensor protein